MVKGGEPICSVRPASRVTIPLPSAWLYRNRPVLTTRFSSGYQVRVHVPAYGIVFERSSER
jgi:hypothetical protein